MSLSQSLEKPEKIICARWEGWLNQLEGMSPPGNGSWKTQTSIGLVIATAATSNTSSSPRFCDGCTLHQSSCRNFSTEISLSRNAVSARHFSTVYCSRHCHCPAIIFLSLSRIAFIADGDHNDSSAHCHWMSEATKFLIISRIQHSLSLIENENVGKLNFPNIFHK